MSARFKVKDHDTWYQVDDVDMVEAVDTGNPGATHKVTGRYQTTYGTMTGDRDPVWVPNTSPRVKGRPRTFTGFSEPLPGYLIDD